MTQEIAVVLMEIFIGMIVAILILMVCVGFGLAVFQLVVWILGSERD
jgi:hypothetical protein